jgi:NAD(P)H-dependent FMN reductase
VAQEIIVAGIVGSLREDSMTRLAVTAALAGAAESGSITHLIDLREYEDTEATADVLRLRADVGSAHGIIIGTPEYHGGYSGLLKNAIDLMGFDEFEGKVVGLIGVSSGSLGASQALQGLRVIGRALHAWVIPQQMSVPKATEHLSTDAPERGSYERRLRQVGHQVARFAALHSSDEASEFLRAWEEAPSNPGGDD